MAFDPRNWGSHQSRTPDGTAEPNSTANRRLRQFWDALVFSSAYIAIIAALEVVLVMLVLDLQAWVAPIAVGCITYTIYASDRLLDVKSDTISAPRRTAFVERHRRPLSATTAIAYGIAVTLSVYHGPLAAALALFPAIVWVVYAVNWTPGWVGSIRRLKEVLLLNSFLIGIAWGVTVVVMPIAYVGAPIDPVAWLLLVYFAIGTFIGTEISNVRDVHADADRDVATLPGRFGTRTTQYLLLGLAVAGIGLLGYGWVDGYLGGLSTAALAIGLVGMMAIVAALDRGVDEAALSILGECARLPSLAIVVLGILG